MGRFHSGEDMAYITTENAPPPVDTFDIHNVMTEPTTQGILVRTSDSTVTRSTHAKVLPGQLD